MSSSVPLLMSSNAAHPMRPATRLNAPPAMNNNARLQPMSSNVLPPMQRNALGVMEDMDTARIARRFPIKAARVSRSRHHPNSAPKFQRRTANRCLFRHQQKFQDKFVRIKDKDMVTK